MLASHTTVLIITIAVYLIFMIAIGVVYSRRNKSTDDFYLGGRKLGWLVTAMSAEASDMSSWLLLGLPGVALYAGLAEASWTAMGLAVGTYFNWLLVARKIRLYTSKVGAVTVPAYFSKRYHEKRYILSLVAAVMIVVFFVPYVASGFNACGTLFSTLFGIDYFPAMIVSALVILLYTGLGGFLAASTTDLIQSIVMTIALFVVVFFGITKAGGWDAVVENAKSIPGYLHFTTTYDVSTGTEVSYSPLTIAGLFAWGLGYFGMPHILLRFMAIEDVNKLKTSRRVATIWVVISMSVAILIGVVGNGMIKAGAMSEIPAEDSQRLIIYIAGLISNHGIFAAVVAGVILSGILAATMSTADSQLLAAASSVSQDIFQDAFHLKLSSKNSMLIARLALVVIGIIAMFQARSEGSVFYIVSFAWAGFGATFGPVVILSLFWKRSNWQGALAGMIVGGVMVFVWKYAVRPLGGLLDIYELLPAFAFAIVVNVIVSLATPAPEESIVKEFDEVSALNKSK